MRVFVDARWTCTDHHNGVSRYGANLIEALNRLHPVTMLIHDRRQLRLLPPEVRAVRINHPVSVRELVLARTLHRLGADVVFSPLQVIGGIGRRYKLVLTVHDLIYYRHPRPPDYLSWPVRAIWRLYHAMYWPQRVLLNRADAVVTVSGTTKQLLAENRLTRRPVVVVANAPHTADELSAEELSADELSVGELNESEAMSGGSRALVYMGSFMPYKNVETLIAGMAHLPGYELHLLSGIFPAREDELRALVPTGSDVVFWRGISDADYHRLLVRARASVTASTDEGFGLPLVEAMSAGTPVVCSDLRVFREVTGGHARFFDPGSPRRFAAAVRQLENPQFRSELVSSAHEQARQFSWDASARTLLDLMCTVHQRDR